MRNDVPKRIKRPGTGTGSAPGGGQGGGGKGQGRGAMSGSVRKGRRERSTRL